MTFEEYTINRLTDLVGEEVNKRGWIVVKVRCKDCKRFEPIENGTGACVDDYGSVMGIHAGDWFCADGEKKC